jgi:hypothetical protein
LALLGLAPNDWFTSTMAAQPADSFSRGIIWQR